MATPRAPKLTCSSHLRATLTLQWILINNLVVLFPLRHRIHHTQHHPGPRQAVPTHHHTLQNLKLLEHLLHPQPSTAPPIQKPPILPVGMKTL